MYRQLEDKMIDLPDPKVLPGTDIELQHYIIGDGKFPLKTYLMKPFARNIHYGAREKVFNYRLSRARRIIQCAFGTLQKNGK